MNKEEKIKEAYGEYWQESKSFVNKNGWMNSKEWLGDIGNTQIFTKLKGIELDCMDNYDQKYCYWFRPKSLQGIENNNGWIKIESEADLPEPEQNVLWLNNENYDMELSSILTCGFDCQDYTHWQPLPEKPPIY